MFIQILLIPFKLVFRLIGLLLVGIFKLVALPFKLLSMVVCFVTNILGVLLIITGVGIMILSAMGHFTYENNYISAIVVALSGGLVCALPYISMGIADLLDAVAEFIGDKFSYVSILPD